MARFTPDNTENYTAADLDELNRRFDAAMAETGFDDVDDIARKSYEDRVAEGILADYDARDDA